MEVNQSPVINHSSVLLSGYSSKIRLSPFGAAIISGLSIVATVTLFGGLAYEKTLTALSQSKETISELRSVNSRLTAENAELKAQANKVNAEKTSGEQLEQSKLAVIHANAAKLQTMFGTGPGFKSEPYKSWSMDLGKEIDKHYALISKEMGGDSK